eukprot:756133-Hanusia_phi.AAC.2
MQENASSPPTPMIQVCPHVPWDFTLLTCPKQQVRYTVDGGMFIENQSNILHLHATSSGRSA